MAHMRVILHYAGVGGLGVEVCYRGLRWRRCTDEYDALFSRVLDVLPLSAVVNESHARTMRELKRHGGHGLGFSELHNEVFQ